MDLEMPLDATAVASLWTWVAVLVAALGIWGIRTVGAKSDASSTTSAFPSPCELSGTGTPTSTQPAPPARKNASDSQPIPEEETGTPRTRFTVYYCSRSLETCRGGEDDEIADEDEEDVTQENARAGECRGRGTAKAREPLTGGGWTVLKRQGDLGWYRYQDVGALSGNVVRLWDGGRGGRFASTATRTNVTL